MAGAKRFASSVALKAISAMPDAMARSLQRAALLAQGQGTGTATVKQEVAAGLSLLPAAKRYRPLVLDVGANVGEWTAALLSSVPDAEVVCFEPSQSAFARLRARFAAFEGVEVIQTAIGRASGTATLWADVPGSGLASLVPRQLDHLDLTFSHAENVRVESLDEWATTRGGLVPDLIKLDVEGYELEALLGATRIVSGTSVVQFEFGGCNIDTRTYFRDFFYFFREAGFDLFRLTPKGLVPVPRYRELDEVFITTNFFARVSKPARIEPVR